MTSPEAGYMREAVLNQQAHIASDVDSVDTALHHSLGYGPSQAASGTAVDARLKKVETGANVDKLNLQRTGTFIVTSTDANGQFVFTYTTALPVGLSSYGNPVLTYGDAPNATKPYYAVSSTASGFTVRMLNSDGSSFANQSGAVARFSYFVQGVR